MAALNSPSASLSHAKELLGRAVKLDEAKRYAESLICYEEAIQILIRNMSDLTTDVARTEMRAKIQGYLERAETVKTLVKTEKEGSLDRVHCVQIKEGDTGYSYSSLFKSYLDANMSRVDVLDPYVRSKHQIHNFVRFCELLVSSCKNLRQIYLTTGQGDRHTNAEQEESLDCLRRSLQKHDITLSICYSSTLHDREIRLGNGWIVKIGRGLDYFQRPEGTFTIGFHNFELRPCHETTVEIFHKLNRHKQ